MQTITGKTLRRWTKEPLNSHERNVKKSKRLAELRLPASRRLDYRSLQQFQKELAGSPDIEASCRLSEALHEEPLEVVVRDQIQDLIDSRFSVSVVLRIPSY